MSPILSIAQFEFRYQLRQPTFYLFVALTLAQSVWYVYQQIALFPTNNSAAAAYYALSSFGLVLAISTVLLTGQSLTKDIEFKTIDYLYTLPITSRMHFAGRFLGTYLAALLLAVFYPLGILIVLIIQLATIENLPWIALSDGLIRLLALNTFIIVCLTFSLTVLLRSFRGAYLSLFLVVLYFLLSESNGATPDNSDILSLLDPFGVGMIRDSINEMPSLPPFDTFLSFSDLFFINRLLWFGLALGVLAQAEAHFSFDTFGDRRSYRLPTGTTTIHLPKRPFIPAVRAHFNRWAAWKTTIYSARFEYRNLLRQPSFQVTTGLLVVLTIVLATTFNQNPDFPELPITSRMTALRLPIGLFISLFLMVMTGELIFQERTIGLWPIYDTLPQPNSVVLFAKLLAMAGTALLFSLFLLLIGIGLQIGNGFNVINWKLYCSDLLIDGFLRYCQLIALAALVGTLVNNRVISHLTNLLILGVLTISYYSNSDSTNLLFSFLPGSTRYSDLIGYGSQESIRPTVHLIWWGIAVFFVTGSLLFWNRGHTHTLHDRALQWQKRLHWKYGLVVAIASLITGMAWWQLHTQQLKTISDSDSIRYLSRTANIKSVTGKTIGIQVKYYHPYQVQNILKVAQTAIQKGEQLFGEFPYPNIQILEIPVRSTAIWSKPGQLAISEKQGWTADYRHPEQLDHMDYLIWREVLKQWLTHRIHPLHQAGEGFIRQSLADYLALQEVSNKYGSERLKQRLAQRTSRYLNTRKRSHTTEKPLLNTMESDASELDRAALALSSIGQVWGNIPLSLTIAQFYQQAVQQPKSATASAFASQLAHRLPDSLSYLATYLQERLWFDFKIGRIANLPNGITVEIIPAKWQENQAAQLVPVPVNDLVPIVVLDKLDHEIYRSLIRPDPDKRDIFLPVLPTAKTVVIDPVGSWMELNKRNNYKIM